MTKLEEKLIQLGYEYYAFDECYRKKHNGYIHLIIEFNEEGKIANEYCHVKIAGDSRFYHEHMLNKHIENVKQAFNTLQNDLKELKEDE